MAAYGGGMKRMIRGLAAAAVGWAAVAVPAWAGTVVVRQGTPAARIYHAPLAQDAEWTGHKAFGKLTVDEMDAKSLAIAIADLNEHVLKMSGTALEETARDRRRHPGQPDGGGAGHPG